MAYAAIGTFRLSALNASDTASTCEAVSAFASVWKTSCPSSSLSFQGSVPRSLRIGFPRSFSRQKLLQVNAVIGYPPSMTWWKKGNLPNMREINSAEEFMESLMRAGDKLVLVDFFSTGCRSCKAMHPKICQLAAENPDMEVFKVDFYENNALCKSLNVNILPFFQFYRGSDGRVDGFSCSLTKVKKLRDAVTKYKNGRPPSTTPRHRFVPSTPTLVPAGSAV